MDTLGASVLGGMPRLTVVPVQADEVHMLRSLGNIVRIPRVTWAIVRRRPWLTIGFVLVLCAGTTSSLSSYAQYRWTAAQNDISQERIIEARRHLEFCARVWPRSADVHFLAARSARSVGDLTAAESYLARCKELEGGTTERVQLENLLIRVQSGQVDDLATGLFEAVERGHPDAAEIMKTIALTYILRQRYKPASACLSLWIEKQPNNPRAYYWRGWALERLANNKAAMQDYQKALELDPGFMEVRLRVVEMLIEDKLAPEAVPHLDLLMKQAPNNPQVQARLGMCRFLEGRTDEARKLMEAAVVHLPNDPILLVSLANLDLQQDRPADAERRLRTVLDADSSDTEALFVMASALQMLGKADESAATLSLFEEKRKTVERINELLKDADAATATASHHAEIGELFLTIGPKRYKYGVYWLERALARDPTNQRARRILVDHYEKQGRSDEAADHRRHLRDPEPKVGK